MSIELDMTGRTTTLSTILRAELMWLDLTACWMKLRQIQHRGGARLNQWLALLHAALRAPRSEEELMPLQGPRVPQVGYRNRKMSSRKA